MGSVSPNAVGIGVYRALSTVNAPRSLHVDAVTMLACLRLQCRDERWKPHVRSFFQEVGIGVIHDMVIEGSLSFRELAEAMDAWEVEEFDSARWIREMAS